MKSNTVTASYKKTVVVGYIVNYGDDPAVTNVSSTTHQNDSSWGLLHFTYPVDVDECAPLKVSGLNSTARLADCQQTCINTDGSFRCSCQSGYRALDDEKQCEG